MKKTLKILAYAAAALALVSAAIIIMAVPELPALLLHKAKSAFEKPVPPEQQLTRVEAYGYAPGSKLEDRMTVMPPALLKYYREWDRAPEYVAYEPKAADKALLLEYLKLLPPAYRKVLEERCLGLYLVKNFKGNGVTTWAVDAQDKVYFHITLNAAGLTDSLSKTLTTRESSCFIPAAGYSVAVDAGEKYKGILYTLLHEGTHGFDYVKGVTPWVDNTMPHTLRPAAAATQDHVRLLWKDFFLPQPAQDYKLRDRITFYSLGGGPKIPFADAPALYAGLKGSPFPSLYGSMSWSENFADLVTMNIITRRLGQPYRITLKVPSGRLVIEPMKSKSLNDFSRLMMGEDY